MSMPNREGWYAAWFPEAGGPSWAAQAVYCFRDEALLMAAVLNACGLFIQPANEMLAGGEWMGPFDSRRLADTAAHSLFRRSA